MEETNSKKPASQPDKGKKGKKEKKNGSFLAEHRAELRKVTWPNRQELVKETVTVIVVSLLVGIIIFAMDYLLSLGYDKLISLGGSPSNSVSTPVDTGLDLPEGVEVITSDAAEDSKTVDVEADAADTEADAADTEADAADTEADADVQTDEAADADAAAADENAEAVDSEADNADADNTASEE